VLVWWNILVWDGVVMWNCFVTVGEQCDGGVGCYRDCRLVLVRCCCGLACWCCGWLQLCGGLLMWACWSVVLIIVFS
jgi:hypothetical protein